MSKIVEAIEFLEENLPPKLCTMQFIVHNNIEKAKYMDAIYGLLKNKLSGQDREYVKERLHIETVNDACQRILKNHGHMIGYTDMPYIIRGNDEQFKLIAKISNKELNIQQIMARIAFIKEIKNNAVSDYELKGRDDFLVLFYHEYQNHLKDTNSIDEDDLPLMVYNLFIRHEWTRGLYHRFFRNLFISNENSCCKSEKYFLNMVRMPL